ncbi:cytochrome P450 family protein [Ceratobasidium sp. AG-Ba]|nr:cytochrome P450 family protein [Ceratobasidium sp. AG-Ba]
MPKAFEHEGFVEMGKELKSDIISLSFFGTTIIVLNSTQATTDLLDKRSNIYSDRNPFAAFRDPRLLNWSTFIPASRYDNLHKKHRRMMHTWLNKQAIPAFHPAHQRQARDFLQRMLQTKGEVITSEYLGKEFLRTFSGTLLQSIYGYNLQSLDDPFMTKPQEAIDRLVQTVTPSAFMVNTFPALVNLPDWFPGTQWKRTLRQWGKEKDVTKKTMVDWTKDQIAAGVSEPSIVGSFLAEMDKWGQTQDEANASIQEVAIGLLAGGTDTVGILFIGGEWKINKLPDRELSKAQEEIDSVVGTDRLPTVEDQPNLPYIRRIMLECARWQPVIPLAVPRRCSEDNEYHGYLIPQGAIIFGNVWAISRNEDVYPDPETFNPDRFLDSSLPPAPVFGWGRRDSSLFLMIVSMLATYNIVPPKDDAGNFVYPTIRSQKFAVFRPTPFECTFVPRSDLHKELIRNGT